MPSVVACPNCQKRYQLPDNFDATRIRCKACNKLFSPTGSRRESAVGATRGAGQSAAGLNQMGLSEIKKQPDLFGNAPVGGADPLRNHVVQDPGFNAEEVPTAGLALAPESATADEAEIVSNPFMKSSGGGQTRSGAKAERERRRKKEDDILKGYEITNSRPGKAENPNKAPGLSRGAYFWNILGLNGFCSIMNQLAVYMAGYSADPENPIPDDAPVMLLMAVLTTMIIAFVGQAFLVYLRYDNMRLNSSVWKNTAVSLTLAPLVLLGIGIIFAMVGVGFIALPALIIGMIAFVLCIPFSMACLVIPPNFGKHGKLDSWSYFWIVFTVLPFIGFVGLLLTIFVF